MNDDLDPNLVRQISSSKEDTEYQMKYLCDETTFMLFDLERGGFINYHGDSVAIDDVWSFTYKRVPVEETIVNNLQTIVSNFFVTVSYNGNLIFDYEVYGGQRKFRVKHVEGFHTGMFLNVLDSYRRRKFQPNVSE